MIGMVNRLVDKLLLGPPATYNGVMGVYYYVDDATETVKTLREQGHHGLSVFSPVPHHDIERAMDQKTSLVRWVTFTGGLLGITGGFALCIYAGLSYPLVTGGKELISIPPFVIIGYESMILLAGLSNLIGMLALARLPQVKSKAPYDPRFTEDKIGIWVPCSGDEARKVEQLMRGHGAEEVKIHG